MPVTTNESAFDLLAPGYDDSFSERPPARWLRQRVRDQVARELPVSARILDIGCGTGVDAVWFAQRGHRVLATDTSEKMLDEARRRIESCPCEVAERISVARLDLTDTEPGNQLGYGKFDLVWSNFGALNCVENLQPLLHTAHGHLSPGGRVCLTMMGRFCLWETVGFLLRGDPRRATRRWRGQAEFEVAGLSQPVWYHSPSAIRRGAAALFEVRSVRGVGVLVPSTEFFHLLEHRPALLEAMQRLERRVADTWPFNGIGDHFSMVLCTGTRERGREQ
jgi:SAM-dependent methyltransferase